MTEILLREVVGGEGHAGATALIVLIGGCTADHALDVPLTSVDALFVQGITYGTVVGHPVCRDYNLSSPSVDDRRRLHTGPITSGFAVVAVVFVAVVGCARRWVGAFLRPAHQSIGVGFADGVVV